MIISTDVTPAVQLDAQAEQVLTAIAESLGLLVTPEEAMALGALSESGQLIPDDQQNLTEAQSIVRLNRAAKLSSLTVRSALVIAQQKKDPLFAKYARAAEIKRRLRGVIAKKYGGAAMSTARRLLANAGKGNMVDISQRPTPFSHPETR